MGTCWRHTPHCGPAPSVGARGCEAGGRALLSRLWPQREATEPGLIHIFNNVLSACCALGTVLGVGDTAMTKTDQNALPSCF